MHKGGLKNEGIDTCRRIGHSPLAAQQEELSETISEAPYEQFSSSAYCGETCRSVPGKRYGYYDEQ
jgi:hypothetical protein